MLKKITIISAILFCVLLSVPTKAAGTDSQIPALNPFCWKKKDCVNIRKQYLPASASQKDLESGFISDSSVAPCTGGTGDDQWGRCLPAGQTKTEISFGGQDTFSNIGDFILLMYKYLVGVASIIAAIMMILAGVQWITSGGNSETISSAKKRISGAVIGLFIAYLSYFILNTINPALVNLRLPQVWLVKPQALVPEFCSQLDGANKGDVKFMYAAPPTDPIQPVTPDTALGKADRYKWIANKTEPQFACGSRFFAENGGTVSCRGEWCAEEDGEEKTCFDIKGDGSGYQCGDVRIAGQISYSSILKGCGWLGGAVKLVSNVPTPWSCPPVNAVKLLPVCGYSIRDVGNVLTDVSGFIQSPLAQDEFLAKKLDEELKFGDGHVDKTNGRYWVEYKRSKVISDIMSLCDPKKGGLKGFVVKFGMNQAGDLGLDTEIHYIGKGGVHLGGFAGGMFFNLYKVKSEYLFSLADILNGVRADVDVANIIRSNSITSENKSYWEDQYK